MSASFPSWVAFNDDGFPVAFARADYLSLDDLRYDGDPGPWAEGNDVRLVEDPAERDRLLDLHTGRFPCGVCSAPLPAGSTSCPHCHRSDHDE